MRFDEPAHQRHVFDRRAAGAESGGGFDEVNARLHAEFAGPDFLVVREQARLEDDLAERVRFPNGLHHALEIGEHDGIVAGLERADVDYHVDLARAVAQCKPGLVHLRLGQIRAEGKPDDRADFDVGACPASSGAGQRGGSAAHVAGVHANRPEPELARFAAETGDVAGGGFGLEQSVVNQRGDVHEKNGALLSGEADGSVARAVTNPQVPSDLAEIFEAWPFPN